MQVENYLKIHQPIIYQTFVNSLKTNRLSHAYLLSGNPGTPLLEIAKHLAKSILCDDPSPLACNTCITCLRVDDDNYPDLFLFDGSKSTIGKDNVVAIENAFDKKAFERFERRGADFEGKRNLWRFPEEVLNEDAKARIKNYVVSDFLNMVRTGKKDMESVKDVFCAQVMVCGIAESVRTGKPFHFTPEMFEL